MVRDVNWLGPDPAPDLADGAGIEVSVKLRSAQPAASALWRAGPDGTARVELLEPQHGIAPGPCVKEAEDGHDHHRRGHKPDQSDRSACNPAKARAKHN